MGREYPCATRSLPRAILGPHHNGRIKTSLSSPSSPERRCFNTMSLLRTSRVITNSRARLQIVPNLTAARVRQQQRALSATSGRSAGDSHAHEDPYEPTGGWLFGVKPGEKYESEGWENVWYYGFFGSLLFGVVGYCYKPDTR